MTQGSERRRCDVMKHSRRCFEIVVVFTQDKMRREDRFW